MADVIVRVTGTISGLDPAAAAARRGEAARDATDPRNAAAPNGAAIESTSRRVIILLYYNTNTMHKVMVAARGLMQTS